MIKTGEKGGTSMPTSYRLADMGRTFSTRPLGAKLREQLLEEAVNAAAVEVDFTEVLSVSYSFADEFVGSMRQQEIEGTLPFKLVIIGASDEVSRVLSRAEAKRIAASGYIEPPCFA
jgi:hypothetical protein